MDNGKIPHGGSDTTTTDADNATAAASIDEVLQVGEYVNNKQVRQPPQWFREKNEKRRRKFGRLRSSRQGQKGCTFEARNLVATGGAIPSQEPAAGGYHQTPTNPSRFHMMSEKLREKHHRGQQILRSSRNDESTTEEEEFCITGTDQSSNSNSNVGSPSVAAPRNPNESNNSLVFRANSLTWLISDLLDNQRSHHGSNRLQPNNAVVAELVDDDAVQAAQNQIDMLREELEGIRQQQLRQAAPIVIAEPIQSLAVSSMPAQGSEAGDHNRPQTKKLHLSSFALRGRDHEISVLHSCLDNTEQKHLVMISGHSGCGKTVLASSLKPAVEELQGLYTSGKFDLYLRDQPYFGINSACEDICSAIMNLKSSRSRKRSFEAIHNELKAALSPQDIQILKKVVPGINTIIDVPFEEQELPELQLEGQDAKNRLHFVFRIFFRTICSFFAPLVLVIDDLQWSDAASLELMQVILTDKANANFLMIGLYRSNEVMPCKEEDVGLESHLVTTVLHELNEKAEDSDLSITEMEIGNLDLDAVHSLVVDSLSLDAASPSVWELASTCHTRTMGNAFFLISFLTTLQEEGLLKYDSQLSKYSWDIARINSQTVATSNVVDLMRRKIKRLPKEMGLVLSIAACLGATFDVATLDAVWKEVAPIYFPTSTIVVEEQLTDAVKEGFIERLDNEKYYRWLHDQIQEAAFSLIPSHEVSDFKFQIGTILRNQSDLEEHIFQVVNLLNEPSSTTLGSTQKMELAHLNLQAAKKALSCSAFSSAAKFASKGIDHLVDGHWKSHYNMSLELYTCAAESHDAIGKYEEMKHFCDEVLKLDCPLLDKVPMYSVLATQLTNSLEHVKATELLIEILDLLGCKYPKSTLGRLIATVAGTVKFKLGIKSRTLEEARSMPKMECPKLLAIMKLNDKLGTSAYLSGSDVTGSAILRSVKLTLQHGASPLSATAFAATTIVTSGVLGDPKSGGKLGEYALQLLTKWNPQHWASRTKFVTAFFAFSWVRSFNDACIILLEAYSEGLQCGDTESAMWAIVMNIELCFLKGTPLKQIREDCSNYSKQMLELKREQALDITKVFWQAVENLMGQHTNGAILQGNILPDFDAFFDCHKDNPLIVALMHGLQLRLHAVFGSFEAGAALFKEHGYDFPAVAPAHPLFMGTVLCGGLCCFALARRSNSKTHRWAKRLAMKARRTISKWVKQGNPNVIHYQALMDAERDALMKRNLAAEKNYHYAIVTATRLGFVHDAALANERLSDFMTLCSSNQDCATFHLKEARRLYAEWGCRKKVEALQKHSLLCD